MENTNNELRFNSGNNFQILKDDDTYTTLGKILGGKLTITEGDTPVVFGDGSTFDGPGAVSCKFTVTLGQVSKENIDLVNSLAGELRKAAFSNGKDVGGTTMEIYIPELKIKRAFELDMKGQTHQVLVIEGSCAPQNADAVCVPDNDLPDDFVASGVGDVTSNNPFYVIVATEPS